MDWHTLGDLMRDLAALLVGAAQFLRALRVRVRQRKRAGPGRRS